MVKMYNTTESGLAEDGVTTATNMYIVWTTTTYLEASCIILSNLLTIITFTINRHLRKRNMYCVINLAVADMLFGIEESVFQQLLSKIYNYSEKVFLWLNALKIFIGCATMFSLALVAVERMCATVWPIRHRNARPWAYTLVISLTWTAALMSGLATAIIMISTMSNQAISLYRKIMMMGGITIVMVVGVICVSYIMIFINVKQQKKQMAGQRISTQDQRLVMTLFIVTVVSIGTWIPLALVWLFKALESIFVPLWVEEFVFRIAFCNSLINPIIYVFRMKDFRKAMLCLILTCSRDRPRLVVPQPN